MPIVFNDRCLGLRFQNTIGGEKIAELNLIQNELIFAK